MLPDDAWKLPTAQLVHITALDESEYEPAAQLEQLEKPLAPWKLPAVQDEHKVDATPEYEPAEQLTHCVDSDEPLELAYVPAAQLTQLVEPELVW